jgi:hypothetical protein
MVCLTIRGDLSSIDSIEYKVKKEIPVVILKGSGGASDIIAFAVEEMSEKYEIFIFNHLFSSDFFFLPNFKKNFLPKWIKNYF